MTATSLTAIRDFSNSASALLFSLAMLAIVIRGYVPHGSRVWWLFYPGAVLASIGLVIGLASLAV